MYTLATPEFFARLSRWAMPLALLLAAIGLGAGLYLGLLASPPDYQQGEFVRIMYVHVPAAWLGLGLYCFIAVCGLCHVIWRAPMSDVLAQSAAPVGALFTLICLVTGMLWGKPMWGAYWVWDARLTSVLVLWFFYLGYMGLADAFEGTPRGGYPAAILALVGALNLPIVKFSVDWWNTLHQPASVIRSGGVALHPDMLKPLLLMALGAAALATVAVLLRARTLLLERKALGLERRARHRHG